MVRLMLVLAPVMCILSGIGVSSILTAYMKNLDTYRRDKKPKKLDSSYPLKNEVCVLLSQLIFTFNPLTADEKLSNVCCFLSITVGLTDF